MNKKVHYLGLDVHKETLAVAIAGASQFLSGYKKKTFGSRHGLVVSGKNVRFGSWHQTPATKDWSAHSANEPAAEWIFCPGSLRASSPLKSKTQRETPGKFYRAFNPA